jgi:hypothetical protein
MRQVTASAAATRLLPWQKGERTCDDPAVLLNEIFGGPVHERAPGSRVTAERDAIVGRDAEVERLSTLAADASGGGRVLLMSAAAGMGKSTLLEYAARRAEEAGHRVLRASGRESERDLAFAGLHQLLRPVLDEAAHLPDRQRRTLLGAFGFVPDAPDPLLTGVAVLTLLSQVAERAPLVVVLDDAQWIDSASADVLAFAARRLDDDPITLLAAVRDDDPVAPPLGVRDGGPGFGRGRDFGQGAPTLVLPPLDHTASRRLLGLRVPGLTGRIRERVLDQAAGNPLALLELAENSSLNPDDHGPLPVGPRPPGGPCCSWPPPTWKIRPTPCWRCCPTPTTKPGSPSKSPG